MLVCLAVYCCSACVSTLVNIYIYTRLYRRGEADDSGNASVAGAQPSFLFVGGTKNTRAGAVKKSFRDVLQHTCSVFFSRFAAG